MNLTGNVYGHWVVLEDKNEPLKGTAGITCQCTCGVIKKLTKSPFLHGYNSTKCFQCNKKLSRICGLSSKK